MKIESLEDQKSHKNVKMGIFGRRGYVVFGQPSNLVIIITIITIIIIIIIIIIDPI
jgi:hypothetical protein